MNVAAIPRELREHDRWVVWRWEPNPAKPKPDKPPYSPARPDGPAHASNQNPGDWGTFEQAVAVVEAGRADGIGFALMPPYVGVDLDAELSEIEQHAILLALDSYTERSASGAGYHAVLRADLNGGKHPSGFGVFQVDRFFYFTGDTDLGLALPETIEERQAQLDAVLEQYLAKSKPTAPATPRQPVDLDDRELMETMFASNSGDKIRRLWDGDWTGYPSQSEADQALCSHLAFWTDRDPARMDAWFRGSGLYREKWERESYREPTIENAIAATAEGFQPFARDVVPTLKPLKPPLLEPLTE